jgi:hypothetical protein
VISGCDEPTQKKAPKSDRAFLSVDFDAEKPMRYKAVSNRTVVLDWNPTKNNKSSTKKYIEDCEMVIVYETVKHDPYGLSTIKATFEEISGKKSSKSNKSALSKLKGKSFTFTIGPNGKIYDDSNMFDLLKEASKAVFRHGKGDRRIKDPDILDDVIAIQLQLWDAPAAVENPAKGLMVGQTWKSLLFIPSSMILREGIDVTYELKDIQQSKAGRTAVVESTYTASEDDPKVKLPYEGSFQLSGTFGFFRSMFKGLSVRDVKGTGRQIYDMESGHIKNLEQNYEAIIKPNAIPMAGTDPVITVNQKTIITFIEN